MKKISFLKSVLIVVFIFISANLIGCKVGPVEDIVDNPKYYYVPQSGGLCGYTAFYMAVKFYGHHAVDTSPDTNIKGTITYSNELTTSSNIYNYIHGINGSGWLKHSALKQAAEQVKLNDGTKLYNTVKLSSGDLGKTDKSAKKQRFENEIAPYLFTDFPVMIHLERGYYFGVKLPGHWITLVGFEWDSENEVITDIYYMDPNIAAHNNQRDRTDGWSCVEEDPNASDYTCFVQKLDYDTFIEGSWYRSDDYTIMAWWDGVYLLFGNVDNE